MYINCVYNKPDLCGLLKPADTYEFWITAALNKMSVSLWFYMYLTGSTTGSFVRWYCKLLANQHPSQRQSVAMYLYYTPFVKCLFSMKTWVIKVISENVYIANVLDIVITRK